MKKTVKKQFWFSPDEADDLKRKAQKTCLTEASLVRLLIRGYEPKERPDERFYTAMEKVSQFTDRLSVLAKDISGSVLCEEIKRWHRFQLDIERRFLRPDRKNDKWQ